MKTNLRNFVPVLGLALIITALAMLKPAQAQPSQQREHSVIMLYLGQSGESGLGVSLSSSSPGAPKFDQGSDPATAASIALSQGYTMRVDGLLITFTK